MLAKKCFREISATLVSFILNQLGSLNRLLKKKKKKIAGYLKKNVNAGCECITYHFSCLIIQKPLVPSLLFASGSHGVVSGFPAQRLTEQESALVLCCFFSLVVSLLFSFIFSFMYYAFLPLSPHFFPSDTCVRVRVCECVCARTPVWILQ